MNTLRPYTAWVTRLLRKIDAEPFLRARVIVALVYTTFAVVSSLIISFALDAYTSQVLADALANPSTFNPEEASAEIEDMRWRFRLVNLALFAVGIYILVGIVLEPIRRAAEFQKRFIANISHELKTPLIAAKMETDLALRNPRLTREEALTLLRRNRDDIRHFARIIQFLTLLSDLSDRSIKRTAEPIMLLDLLTRVRERYAERAPGITIRAEGTAVRVIGNAIALEKLVSNLLRNALAHTHPGGSIVLRAEQEGSRVVLSVIDTGTGIPREDIPKLFEPFYKEKNSAPGGSGLGLSIVREIARIHSARVWVESVLGKGTRVFVAFPMAA